MTTYTIDDTWKDIILQGTGDPLEDGYLTLGTRFTHTPILAGVRSAADGVFPDVTWEVGASYVAPVWSVTVGAPALTNDPWTFINNLSSNDKAGFLNTRLASGFVYVIQEGGSYGADTGFLTDSGNSIYYDYNNNNPQFTFYNGTTTSTKPASGFSLARTMVLNTATETILIFSSVDGSKVAEFNYGAEPNKPDLTDCYYHVSVQGSGFAETLEVYPQKETMPYDLTAGDLGIYLAAFPNWLQVGETSSGLDIDPNEQVVAKYFYEGLGTFPTETVLPDFIKGSSSGSGDAAYQALTELFTGITRIAFNLSDYNVGVLGVLISQSYNSLTTDREFQLFVQADGSITLLYGGAFTDIPSLILSDGYWAFEIDYLELTLTVYKNYEAVGSFAITDGGYRDPTARNTVVGEVRILSGYQFPIQATMTNVAIVLPLTGGQKHPPKAIVLQPVEVV